MISFFLFGFKVLLLSFPWYFANLLDNCWDHRLRGYKTVSNVISFSTEERKNRNSCIWNQIYLYKFGSTKKFIHHVSGNMLYWKMATIKSLKHTYVSYSHPIMLLHWRINRDLLCSHKLNHIVFNSRWENFENFKK